MAQHTAQKLEMLTVVKLTSEILIKYCQSKVEHIGALAVVSEVWQLTHREHDTGFISLNRRGGGGCPWQ